MSIDVPNETLHQRYIDFCAEIVAGTNALPSGGGEWFRKNAKSNRERFGECEGEVLPQIMSM